MGFEPLAEIEVASHLALVYEEGWQSWSPVRVLRGDETSARPRDATHRTMGWRSDKPLPERGFQGEGADVAENVAAAGRLDLPIEIVQVDDGQQAGIGDWLDVSPRFGSLAATAERIVQSGRLPGIWTAPFLACERSRLAQGHPDWLVEGADAGENWGHRLRVLDVTHPAAAQHLEQVYRTLRELGFGFHKLDFLYAGALPGIDAYVEGLRIVRRGAGDDAILLGCGAPLLPSIGLVDAMRIGPDVIGMTDYPQRMNANIEHARTTTGAGLDARAALGKRSGSPPRPPGDRRSRRVGGAHRRFRPP